jgi:hypothetical protein
MKRIGIAIAAGFLIVIAVRFWRWYRVRWLRKIAQTSGNLRPKAHDAEMGRARAIERLLASVGFVRNEHTPMLTFVETIQDKLTPVFSEQLLRLVDLYLRARFGAQGLSTDEESEFGSMIRQLANLRSIGQARRAN